MRLREQLTRMHSVSYIGIGICLVALGALLGAWMAPFCLEEHELLSPSVGCGTQYAIDKKAYTVLKNEIATYITERIENGDITSASVYFRDLERGPTFGINEYDAFSPATLLKLTLVTAYVQYAEEYPELLSEIVLDSSAPTSTQGVRMNELLTRVARDSDEDAYQALRAHLLTLPEGTELLKRRAEELGLLVDIESGIENPLSIKAYSSMLHALFFARFLPPDVANEVLAMMRDDARSGIASVIPESVSVVHRRGTQTRLIEGRSRSYDCGIVYFPQNAFSLCITVLGFDEEKNNATIEYIARSVFEEVDSRRLSEYI